MGRLSKKAIEEKKKERRKHVLTLALQSLAEALIFSLLMYIIVGNSNVIEIIQSIQENGLVLESIFTIFPLVYIVIFTYKFFLDGLDK